MTGLWLIPPLVVADEAAVAPRKRNDNGISIIVPIIAHPTKNISTDMMHPFIIVIGMSLPVPDRRSDLSALIS